MPRLYLMKQGHVLHPADGQAAEILAKFKQDQIFTCEVRKARNAAHHCKAFAMLQRVFDAQDNYTNFEAFRKAVLIQAGHFDVVMMPDGKAQLQGRSMSFDTLDQIEFDDLYKRMFDALLEDFLPESWTQDQLSMLVDELVRGFA